MVESLNSPEISKILEELMGGTATILEKSYVKIYTADADDKKQRYQGSNISGICCLVFDKREGKVAYLRVYDAANLKTLFSIELFYGFIDCWTQLLPNFYTIPFFQGYIGFLFPNAKEAQKMTIKIGTASPKQDDYEKILTDRKKLLDDLTQPNKQYKAKGAIFEKFKGVFGEKEELQKPKINGPSGSAMKSSMKFNTTTGEVDMENLPAEYIKIFKNAGITKKDLQNKETAQALFLAIAQMNEDPNVMNQSQSLPQTVTQDNSSVEGQDFSKEKKEKKSKLSVSGQRPSDLQSSIKFNEITGEVDLENLSAEYIQIFKNAGITKKDLQNKETAKALFMAIAKMNEDPNVMNQSKSLPQTEAQDNSPGKGQDGLNQKEKNKKLSVSRPSGHPSSIKFNEITGQVDLENLSAEYIQIFKNAGITKKDLENKETAKALFMAIAKMNEDPTILNESQTGSIFSQQQAKQS